MSEVGAGGKGLDGNLKLAEKLIHDIRLLRPAAWLDWQYIEDNNDQWCLVKGDFYGGTQEFHKVKNYYVRQQFSRFIPEGYQFIHSSEESTLAALSPQADTLVIVSINRTEQAKNMQVDISGVTRKGIRARKAVAYRTSETSNLDQIRKGIIMANKDKSLSYCIPARSIITLVMPLRK